MNYIDLNFENQLTDIEYLPKTFNPFETSNCSILKLDIIRYGLSNWVNTLKVDSNIVIFSDREFNRLEALKEKDVNSVLALVFGARIGNDIQPETVYVTSIKEKEVIVSNYFSASAGKLDTLFHKVLPNLKQSFSFGLQSARMRKDYTTIIVDDFEKHIDDQLYQHFNEKENCIFSRLKEYNLEKSAFITSYPMTKEIINNEIKENLEKFNIKLDTHFDIKTIDDSVKLNFSIFKKRGDAKNI